MYLTLFLHFSQPIREAFSFACEPEVKPRCPARLSAEPRRKTFFTILILRAPPIFLLKGKESFSARQAAVLGGWRRSGAIGFFRNFA